MPRIHVAGAAVFYGVMLGLALFWAGLRGDANLFVLPPAAVVGPVPALPWRVLLGCGVGLVFVLTARVLSRRMWVRGLNAEFRRLLGPLTLSQISVLAVLSAVGEEAFFRGAMQPDLGYIPTSIIFGLLHIGPGRNFWPWTLSALVAGFSLGAITLYTGDLLAATLGHFTVNYFNLWQLCAEEKVEAD